MIMWIYMGTELHMITLRQTWSLKLLRQDQRPGFVVYEAHTSRLLYKNCLEAPIQRLQGLLKAWTHSILGPSELWGMKVLIDYSHVILKAWRPLRGYLLISVFKQSHRNVYELSFTSASLYISVLSRISEVWGPRISRYMSHTHSFWIIISTGSWYQAKWINFSNDSMTILFPSHTFRPWVRDISHRTYPICIYGGQNSSCHLIYHIWYFILPSGNAIMPRKALCMMPDHPQDCNFPPLTPGHFLMLVVWPYQVNLSNHIKTSAHRSSEGSQKLTCMRFHVECAVLILAWPQKGAGHLGSKLSEAKLGVPDVLDRSARDPASTFPNGDNDWHSSLYWICSWIWNESPCLLVVPARDGIEVIRTISSWYCSPWVETGMWHWGGKVGFYMHLYWSGELSLINLAAQLDLRPATTSSLIPPSAPKAYKPFFPSFNQRNLALQKATFF